MSAGKLHAETMAGMLPAITAADRIALECWDAIGSKLDWPALMVWLELYEATDPQDHIDRLMAIRAAVREHVGK